ncbi:MAG: nucleoside hydrolase [Pseudomonadales bacterium]|jgi:inosine-uridine nucleoside N-ribohydrolase
MSTPWILDTDPGIDDALALFYLLGEASVEIVGLTTVFGNVDIDRTTRNARQLLDLAQHSAWVARGASRPLQILPNPPADFVHGVEGLGDEQLPPPISQVYPQTAAQAIVEASKRIEPLHLAPVGPLTNVAQALQLEPELVERMAGLTIMGGNLDSQGNVSQHAEANIWNDPHAARQVLRAGWPIRLVGLDCTSTIQLTESDFEDLPGAAGQILRRAAGSYINFYRAQGFQGCQLHDPAAVMAGIAPELFDWEATGVDVICEGSDVGRVVRDSSAPLIQVAMGCDVPAVKARFLSRLKSTLERLSR